MKIVRKEASLAGRKLVFETGRLASLADSSVLCSYGGTQVLATFTVSDKTRDGVDYLPLMVDYEERLYAAGKIKGSRFIKREGRPTDDAVLTGRLIDRALRPLFNSKIRNDLQVVTTVLSVDENNNPGVVALMAASAAVRLSGMKLEAPLVSGVRVAKVKDDFVINPTAEQMEEATLDLLVAASEESINMIEAGGQEISEDEIAKGLELAHNQVKKILSFADSFAKEAGVKKFSKELIIDNFEIEEELKLKIESFVSPKLDKALFVKDKAERDQSLDALKKDLLDSLGEGIEDDIKKQAASYLEDMVKARARESVLNKGKRVDGRKASEIRELSCEVSSLTMTHGSAVFNRGNTQVLSVVTLGAPGEELVLDEMGNEGKKRYMHHYNFPGFSVGEVAPMRGPGRREIGHGALAEKAIVPVLPSQEEFPYTMRVVSEVLSSNGSSSMASTCGSSLSLMDAGVPLTKPVAGIAMGIITSEKDDKYAILTDIQGIEDHDGDMDLKIAGTKDGITAMQMDVKVAGLPIKVLVEALAQSKEARLEILSVMNKVIPEPREKMSEYAPKIVTLKINPEKIGALIGPGGKMINSIIDETGVKINVEDDGTVNVTGKGTDDIDGAVKTIEGLTQEAKVGGVYNGVVKKVEDFGAFIQIFPGQDGLLHVSELRAKDGVRVDVRKNFEINQVVKVCVKEIDSLGRVNLGLAE